jgi:hypothetical protein
MAMVIALGWRLFGPLALTMAGAEAHDPAQYTDQVQGYVRRFAKAAVMPESPPPTPRSGGATVRAPTKRQRAG